MQINNGALVYVTSVPKDAEAHSKDHQSNAPNAGRCSRRSAPTPNGDPNSARTFGRSATAMSAVHSTGKTAGNDASLSFAGIAMLSSFQIMY